MIYQIKTGVKRRPKANISELAQDRFGLLNLTDSACNPTLCSSGTVVTEANGGAEKRNQQSMRRFWTRRELRLEKRGDEERVIWKFNRSRLTLNSFGAYAEAGSHKLLFIILVHTVVAVVLLGVVFITADFVQQSAGDDLYAFFT